MEKLDSGAATGGASLALSRDDFIWAVGSLCQLNRIPFDAALVASQFPAAHDAVTLLDAATRLGLKCRLHAEPAATADSWVCPSLVFLREAEAIRPVLLAKVERERVLLFRAGSKVPVVLARAEFDAAYAGGGLFAAAQATAATDADAPATRRPFGFGWFVPELLKHRSIWRDVLLASLAIQLMALATPLATQVVIDKVVVHHTLNTLVVVGVAMALFMVFSAIMSWVRQYLVLHTGNRIDAVLGSKVFEHLVRLPLRYYESRPVGVVVARVQGVEQIREFLASAAVTVLLDCPFMLVFLAIMFYYSVPLTLVTLGLLGAIVVLSLVVAPILRRRLNEQFLLGARNQAFLTEYIGGMETLKSLQMEPQLNARFGDFLASYMHAGFRTRQLGNTYNTAANLLEQLLTLSILCFGAWLVMRDAAFTIGMLVAFQMFAGRLSQPLLRLVGLWQQFQQANIAVQRLGDLMDSPAEPYALVPQRSSNGAAGAGGGAIEVRELAFRYAAEMPFLYRNFNLTVRAGQCVALMGPSGSGKSTLAKLLQGFYWASEGSILVDGRDTRHLAANELRQYFGVVPQDTVLFSGTVLENLTLANPQATFEDAVQACRMAEIHDTIEKLPKGYQTTIGERGVGLSGGQKQRIAIARALLKRPRVLIFDEAVSSLDAPTAEAFARTVNALRGRATILFITHQLPRALRFDAVHELGGTEKHFDIIRSDATPLRNADASAPGDGPGEGSRP